MIWVEVSYATQIGNRFSLFKVRSNNPFVAVCRCPYCGDSQRNKYKTRGYIYEHKGKVLYHCHNCGKNRSLRKLIEDHDPMLLQQYDLECFKESNQSTRALPLPKKSFESKIEKFSRRAIKNNEHYKKIKTISQLPVGHPAKKYVEARKIPAKQHWRIYWVDNFYQWVNQQIPEKFPDSMSDEGRIVFPFVDRYGAVFGFQGRSIDKNGSPAHRYITILLHEDMPRLFGFDTADLSQEEIFVFEGGFDSMFFSNAVAQAGGENNNLEILLNMNKVVFVLDNEPRSFDTCARLQKLINSHKRVVIWPDNIKEKDVNDMILAGYDPDELLSVMRKNIFYGASAQLRMNAWRRINSRRTE